MIPNISLLIIPTILYIFIYNWQASFTYSVYQKVTNSAKSAGNNIASARTNNLYRTDYFMWDIEFAGWSKTLRFLFPYSFLLAWHRGNIDRLCSFLIYRCRDDLCGDFSFLIS